MTLALGTDSSSVPQAETPSGRIKFLDGLNRSFAISETMAVLVASIGQMLQVFW